MSISSTSIPSVCAAKLAAAVEQLTPDTRPRTSFLRDLSKNGPMLAAAVERGVSYTALTDEIFRVYGHRLKPESLRKRLAQYIRAARSNEESAPPASEQHEVAS